MFAKIKKWLFEKPVSHGSFFAAAFRDLDRDEIRGLLHKEDPIGREPFRYARLSCEEGDYETSVKDRKSRQQDLAPEDVLLNRSVSRWWQRKLVGWMFVAIWLTVMVTSGAVAFAIGNPLVLFVGLLVTGLVCGVFLKYSNYWWQEGPKALLETLPARTAVYEYIRHFAALYVILKKNPLWIKSFNVPIGFIRRIPLVGRLFPRGNEELVVAEAELLKVISALRARPNPDEGIGSAGLTAQVDQAVKATSAVFDRLQLRVDGWFMFGKTAGLLILILSILGVALFAGICGLLE